MLELRYSTMGSLFSLMVQPAADLSADASDSSNACLQHNKSTIVRHSYKNGIIYVTSTYSQVRLGRPSISKILPLKIFFLPFFSTVSMLFWMA
jgi:hypothetical protein